MICPYCKSEQLKVLDKRNCTETAVRRRRECETCGKRFTTYERIERVTLNVQKRDGRVEEFDREKLKRGIKKAVSKRGISEEVIDEMIFDIESNLMSRDEQTIFAKEIGEMVLQRLTKIDKLAALLFAAVYKDFKKLEDVHKELVRLEELKN